MELRLEDRRTPRVPLHATGVLATGRARFPITVADLGAGGCRVVSPIQLRRGEAVYVTLDLPGGALTCNATVAWSTRAAPWLTGLEFPRAGVEERVRRVAALDPDRRRAPAAALAGEAPLRLGPAPHPRTAFTREELQVLLAARAGTPVLSVARAPGLKRALVKLLARGLVSAGGPPASEAGWSALLREGAPAPAPLVVAAPAVVVAAAPARSPRLAPGRVA